MKITYNGIIGVQKSAYDAFVGRRIQQRRVELGLVQTDANNPHNRETLLDRIRKLFPDTTITDSTIQSVELGRGRLRLEDAAQICMALRMPLSDLLAESDKPFEASVLKPDSTNSRMLVALMLADHSQDVKELSAMGMAVNLSACVARLERLLDVCPLHNGLLDMKDLDRARVHLNGLIPDNVQEHVPVSANQERVMVSREIIARFELLMKNMDEILCWFRQSEYSVMIQENMLTRIEHDCQTVERQMRGNVTVRTTIQNIQTTMASIRKGKSDGKSLD